MIDKDTLISNQLEVAEKLNNFFIESVENLEIEPYLTESTTDILDENIQEIIDLYKDHPSIVKIKKNVEEGHSFSFKDTTPQDFEKEILKLDTKKATPSNDIPTKMIVLAHDIISNHLSDQYNKSKNEQSYPDTLKLVDVAAVHKKRENSKKNLSSCKFNPCCLKII